MTITDEEFDRALHGGPATEFTSERLIGRELPPPIAPMNVARDLMKYRDVPLRFWRGDHYEYREAHWARIGADEVRSWVYAETEASTYAAPDKDGNPVLKKWHPDRKKIADVMDALNTNVIGYHGEAARGIFTLNGEVLSRRKVVKIGPGTFNLTVLPFNHDPLAECPQWLKFLSSTLPDDANGRQFLKEWFGYVLSGRTNLDKMACLIGEPRSGKGTISRILQALVGEDGHTGLSLQDIAGDFTKSALIGKLLGVISEPDWKMGQQAVSTILRITGGDEILINRKNKDPLTVTVGARLMVLANDAPRLINRSGALEARMINLRFTESFVGREDIGLPMRLLAELPGILNWAMEGLADLEAQGQFTLPYSHQEMAEAFREYADPDTAFVQEMGGPHPDAWCTRDELIQALHAWCKRVGRSKDTTDAITLINRLHEKQVDGVRLFKFRYGQRKEWRLRGFCPDAYAFEDSRGNKVTWQPALGQRPGEAAAPARPVVADSGDIFE